MAEHYEREDKRIERETWEGGDILFKNVPYSPL